MINYAQRLPILALLKKVSYLTVGFAMILAQAAFAWEKDRPATPPVIPPNPNNLPRVLLIGDSICGGYFKSVAKALEGKAVVAKSSDNGESTAVGVIKIDGWLGDIRWDVIHFNWGVWDMYGWQYASDDRSPAAYAQRLEKLVVRMKKTGARLIWATTTPVPPGAESTMLKRWKKEVVIDQDLERQYREAALQVMKKYEVQVDDLYALMKPRRSEFQKDDNVHFSAEGSALMAKQVADCILKNLGSAPEKNDTDIKQEPPSAKKSIKELQQEFLKMKFGMFICYAMETMHETEWVAGYPDPSTFNPGGKVNTDAWADAAVSAGMKYGVLTVKHVSGFCLWDSKYTTYDIMHPNCTYKEDLVAQYIKSFKSRGLKIGIYYCWRNPGFGDPKKYKVLPPECDPATHSLQEQNEFQKNQIAELLAKYPDVEYIWNDGIDDQIMPPDEFLTHIRAIRPNIIASANWWDWGKKGMPYLDIAVTETKHFKEGNTAPGETCWCLENGDWFWNKGSTAKSPESIVPEIITANSRNANFLLNVGPDKQGNIVESSVKALAEIGRLNLRCSNR